VSWFEKDDRQRNSSQKHPEQIEDIRLLPQPLNGLSNELPVLLCTSFYAALFRAQRTLGNFVDVKVNAVHLPERQLQRAKKGTVRMSYTSAVRNFYYAAGLKKAISDSFFQEYKMRLSRELNKSNMR
jgi:hypothetical protein